MKHDSKWIAIIGIAACIIAVEANACYGTGCYNTYSDMMDSSQHEVDRANAEMRVYEIEQSITRMQQEQDRNGGAYFEQPSYSAPCYFNCN